MPKFFVNRDQISENSISIIGKDAFHIARALRMAVGDLITVSDGEGKDYRARLTRIRDEECLCEIADCSESSSEPPVKITLFMAYPKSDKLETVIQKAVELGAARIIPFESSRCIKRPKAEKQEKQTERLTRIAEEAAKQCGRSALPSVSQPLSYKEMLSMLAEYSLSLFCYEGEEDTSFKKAIQGLQSGESIAVIVGSEGGFSPEEAALAKAAGARSVTLGKRILRCETAPLFALSCIAYELEL